MKTCREAYDAAEAYIDGELPEQGRAEMAAHLEKCSDCQAYVAQVRTVVGELGNLDESVADEESKARAVEAFRQWREDIEESARRPTEPMPGLASGFWARCLSRRHLVPASGIALVVTPIFLVVNHYACLMHGGFPAGCLAQSMGLSLIPFAAALFSSVRTEQRTH